MSQVYHWIEFYHAKPERIWQTCIGQFIFLHFLTPLSFTNNNAELFFITVCSAQTMAVDITPLVSTTPLVTTPLVTNPLVTTPSVCDCCLQSVGQHIINLDSITYRVDDGCLQKVQYVFDIATMINRFRNQEIAFTCKRSKELIHDLNSTSKVVFDTSQ